MAVYLFTGIPGFLGSELLREFLAREPESSAICLVQRKFAALAAERTAAYGTRVKIVEGDITRPGLDLADPAVAGNVTSIFHLAAVYDLAVRRDVAMLVNVEGTRNVLEFAASCPGLNRLHYVSTCYVSGAHPGVFFENDLDLGQRFNNYYEETKFLAEIEVQKAMRAGMPVTVYRPSIVVGDSRTGETQKFDGPYYAIRLILRQPGVALLPVVGNPHRARLNVVPRDFIMAALVHLATLERSAGKVYQLADPDAPTITSMMSSIAAAAHRRVIRVPIPIAVGKFAIDRVPGVDGLLQIPAQMLDYMVHPTIYDTTNATGDLAGTGIAVPPFSSYAQTLVRFVEAHPEIGSAAMV